MQPELFDSGRCGRPHISNGERVPAGKDGKMEQTYRQVPVFPHDRLLLGMLWKDRVYVDKVLPLS